MTSYRRRLRRSMLVAVLGCAITSSAVGSPALAETTTPSTTATPSPSPTASPSSTPTSIPTPTNTKTPTSKPTLTPKPSRTATAPPTASSSPSTPGIEEALTPEQVRAQVAASLQLRAELGRSDARLSAAIRELGGIAASVSAALERQRSADQAATTARRLADTQLSRLVNLRVQVAQGQDDLGRWARAAYAAGGTLAAFEGWITALGGASTQDVAHDLALLEHVGVARDTALSELQDASAAQKVVATTAARAAQTATAAQARAVAARAQAASLLLQQRQVLAGLQASELRTVGRAQTAKVLLGRSTSGAALAAQAQLAAVLAARRTGRPVPMDPGDCQGLDTRGYANGEIPTAALCPMWGAPDKVLRADAAAAFRDLSKAFAGQFGRPLCVTDAYRSRGEQVVVFAQRPSLAARPGASNHGWGTAVDLCGGVQSFATLEHIWMLTHAGLYGWFHPSWAEPTGGRPEPWHWEFAG